MLNHCGLLHVKLHGVFTWRRLVSAVPESCAGPPSWLSPLPVGGVSLPALGAGPPGSFSSARDASGAVGTAGSKVKPEVTQTTKDNQPTKQTET